MKRFPSRFDNTLLQYWVIPNTYEDTLDSFVENMPAEEIYAYNNVAIWMEERFRSTDRINNPNGIFLGRGAR